MMNRAERNFLHVVRDVSSGGIGSFVSTVCRMNSQSDSWHDILLLGTGHDSKGEGNFHVFSVGPPIYGNLAAMRSIASIVAQYQGIFLHCPHPVPAMTSFLNGIPTLTFQHGLTFSNASWLKKLAKTTWYEILVLCLSRKVVCSTQYASKKMRERGIRVPQSRIEVVEFGIELPTWIREDRSERTRPELHVGTAGRMVEQKRFDILLESLSGYCGPQRIVLHFAGDGPDLSRLQHLARSLDSSWVETVFHGWIGDMRDFYDLLDIFVFPSHSESFGLVVAEALAAKLPVIVFHDLGGADYLVKDGINGRILNNPGELCGIWSSPAAIKRITDMNDGISGSNARNLSILETRNRIESLLL